MSLSPSLSISLRALATARMLVGSSTLLLPSHSAWIFGLSPSIAAAANAGDGFHVLARLFGVRDMVMGGYLWKSLSELKSGAPTSANQSIHKGEIEPLTNSTSITSNANLDMDNEMKRYSSLRQLRHALWLGIICDAIDVCSCLACFLDGNLQEPRAIVLVWGGAALFAGMGITGLRAVKSL